MTTEELFNAKHKIQNNEPLTDRDKLLLLADRFTEEMQDIIEENWTPDDAEIMNRHEAKAYLGHDVKNMSDEEIKEEISDIQLEYYISGYNRGGADLNELIDKFLKMDNPHTPKINR